MIEERTSFEVALDDAVIRLNAGRFNDPQPLVRHCSSCGARMARSHDGILRCGCGRVRFS